MGEKVPEQSNNTVSLLNYDTALKVRRITNDLINMLDFRNKLEIAVSDILGSIVSGLSENESKNKQKNQEKLGRFHCLFICFQMATQNKKLEIPNLKFEILN